MTTRYDHESASQRLLRRHEDRGAHTASPEPVAQTWALILPRLGQSESVQELDRLIRPRWRRRLACQITLVTSNLHPVLNISESVMRVIHFSEARNSLRAVIDQVIDDADHTVMARRDAPDAVVMSLDTLAAWEDHEYGQGQDRKALKRIYALIKDTLRHPFEGIGKPEPLKENLSGFWSRRIDDTHRLVYCVDGPRLVVIACCYHYQ